MKKLFFIVAITILSSGVTFANGNYGLVGGGVNACGTFGGTVNYFGGGPAAVNFVGNWTHITTDGRPFLIHGGNAVQSFNVDIETGFTDIVFSGLGNFPRHKPVDFTVEVRLYDAGDDCYNIYIYGENCVSLCPIEGNLMLINPPGS